MISHFGVESKAFASSGRFTVNMQPQELAMGDPRQGASNDTGDESVEAVAQSYSEYLKLPALLELQRPLTVPAVHDELLFIIVHQAHELWFKQILCELSLLISDIDAGSFDTACRTVERMTRIAQLLTEHMRVLETMPQDEFQRFRSALGTASGIESEQFHRLEQLAGLSSEAVLAPILPEPSPSSSVREAFWRMVVAAKPGAKGLVGADVAAAGRALAGLLAAPELGRQRRLADAMLAFDQNMASWRCEHFEIARRMIGGATGTGGSSGAAYLRRAMDRRFFPELWHWRQTAQDTSAVGAG